MPTNRFLTACRTSMTTSTVCCFATALALLGAEAAGFVVRQVGVPWPKTGWLLAAGIFYLILGACYLAENLWQRTKLEPVATAPPCDVSHGRVNLVPSQHFATASPQALREEIPEEQDVMAGV